MSEDDDLVEYVATAMAKDEGDPVMDHWRRRARAAIKAMEQKVTARELAKIWDADDDE